MFFNKSKERELRNEIERLEAYVKTLEARIEQNKQQAQAAAKQQRIDNENAEFVFDFKTMNAFSVERLYDANNNTWKTIVGYVMMGVEGVKEWVYYCSLERHKEIAAAFNKHLESKKK